MNRFIITSLSLLLFVSTYGQNSTNDTSSFGFLQKEIFIEGNLQYSSVDNQTLKNKTTSLGINPKVGYFFIDNLAIGLEGNYNINKSTTIIIDGDAESVRKVEENFYAPGIFARYYFLQFGKRFFTYAELGGNYGKTDSFTDIDGEKDNELTTKRIGADLSLGLNYFVNDNIVISFNLADVVSYTSEKLDIEDAESTNTLNANLNLFNNFFQTAQFGVMFILN